MGRYVQRKCISLSNSKKWDDSHIHNKRFSRAALTKYHKPSGLKQQKFIVSVLDARSPKSICQEVHALWMALEENLFMPFSSLLVSPAILGVLYLTAA